MATAENLVVFITDLGRCVVNRSGGFVVAIMFGIQETPQGAFGRGAFGWGPAEADQPAHDGDDDAGQKNANRRPSAERGDDKGEPDSSTDDGGEDFAGSLAPDRFGGKCEQGGDESVGRNGDDSAVAKGGDGHQENRERRVALDEGAGEAAEHADSRHDQQEAAEAEAEAQRTGRQWRVCYAGAGGARWCGHLTIGMLPSGWNKNELRRGHNLYLPPVAAGASCY